MTSCSRSALVPADSVSFVTVVGSGNLTMLVVPASRRPSTSVLEPMLRALTDSLVPVRSWVARGNDSLGLAVQWGQA